MGGHSEVYSAAHAFRFVATFGLACVYDTENEEMTRLYGQSEPFDVSRYFCSDALQTKPLLTMSKSEKSLLYRAVASLVSHRGERDAEKERHFTVMAIVLVHCLIYKV